MSSNYFINKRGNEVSCGVLVTDGKKVLAIKPWGKTNALDIPKGHRELGELEVEAAVRELKEETGWDIPAEDLVRAGAFEYTSYKDLVIFVAKKSTEEIEEKLPSLTCTSYFTDNDTGKKVPEATDFVFTEFDNKKFYRGLLPILKYLRIKVA